MKNRLTKFFTVFLAVVLCIGMAPATGSTAYAASRWGGSSISSWWNSWFGGSNSGSNNNNSSSNSNQAGENDATSSNSSTVDLDELDGSGSSDGQLSLTKSITHNGGDNYTIRLEAYATGEVKNTTVTKDVPTDIVLVLDQSGSMKEKMITTRYEKVYSLDKNATYYIKTDSGWRSVSYRYWGAILPVGGKAWRTGAWRSGIKPKTNASDTSSNTVQFYTRIVDNSSETRLQALQAAVNSFITNVKNKANGKEDLYRVAIVGFASGQKYNGGTYNYGNTEVFVGSNQYTYNAGSSNNASNPNSAQSHYKDALQDLGTTTGYDNLIASKDSLSADGGTIANLGMEMAKGILNNSPTDHNKAIVMFTDGQPGWSGFDENVANSTIKESYNSKSNGTSVYTVGVFGGDDLTTDVQTYMSRTSSNYPTAQNMTDELTEESTDYYMTADNAADLNNIFKQISDNIQTGSTTVTLDQNSVLKDVVSDDFTLTNAADTSKIVVKTADYKGGDVTDASSWATPTTFKDAEVSISGKTINVSNFNYKELYAATINGKNQGKKLIVEIPVTINRSFGANNVLSNASAGIYPSADATDAFITVESPEGSHPTEYGVKGTEQWIDPDTSVTLKSLIDYASSQDGFEYKPDGTKNKYVDIVYTITDKDGNTVGTYTVKAGQTKGTASPVNTPTLNVDTVYTVTAKVTPIASATDADKACGRQAEEKTYTTTSKVYINGVTRAFVIDFDKPVTYTKEQVFTENQLSTPEKINSISYKEGSNTYGTLTLNNETKAITYKLKTFMDGIDTYEFNVANKCTQTVKMMPATSVYYDDSFTAKDGNGIVDGITYTGDWQVADKKDIGYQDSTQGEDTNYGYDSSEELIGNSNGTIHFIDGTNTELQTASLTFKGKGIDIYGKVDNTTGKIAARLYKDGTLVDSRVITTTYQSGTLYQVPTITFKDLEYGQYTVKITIPKGQIFYLDGLRIYNPTQDKDAQDKYTQDKENDATVVYLRDVLAGTNKKGLVTKAKGTVFIDEYLTKDAATKKQSVVKAHNLDVDSSDPLQEYIKYGCKQAETNIPAGASMKITLDDSYSNVQIGLKTSSEGAEYKINSSSAIPLRSSTDMYYKVTLNSDNTFTITNCSKVMIQITSIKAIK